MLLCPATHLKARGSSRRRIFRDKTKEACARERRERETEESEKKIWKASKVVCTCGEFKMIMDNSKVWPHEGVKIVHSQYFTAAARLTGRRGLGDTSKSTQGEQCHLERETVSE